jgi:hypothetical protein
MRAGYVKLRLQIAFFLQPLVLRIYYMNECAEAFIVCQGDGVSRVGKIIACRRFSKLLLIFEFYFEHYFYRKWTDFSCKWFNEKIKFMID